MKFQSTIPLLANASNIAKVINWLYQIIIYWPRCRRLPFQVPYFQNCLSQAVNAEVNNVLFSSQKVG